MSKCQDASLFLQKYISLVVDGADQSKFALPWVTTRVKDQRGDGLSVHLIGLLHHQQVNRLRLFTITDENATWVNHITASIYRQLNEIDDDVPTLGIL